MKEFVLIEVVERGISAPVFFDSFDLAHDKMCERISTVLNVSKDEIECAYQDDRDFDDYTYVSDFEAWTEKYGMNFDWKIFEVAKPDDDVSYAIER